MIRNKRVEAIKREAQVNELHDNVKMSLSLTCGVCGIDLIGKNEHNGEPVVFYPGAAEDFADYAYEKGWRWKKFRLQFRLQCPDCKRSN